MFVARPIQHAMRMCHVVWPAWLYNIFPNFPTNGTIFENKITGYKTFVLSSSIAFVCNNPQSTKTLARCDKNV